MAVSKTWRGLVSLIMFASMGISAITGIVLYIVPEGRVAYWVLWDLMGITKTDWQSLHTYSSLLLLIFGIFHVINNWGSIKNYVVKKSGGVNQKGNLLAVTVIALIIIVSGIWQLPPLQWIMDFGEHVKGMWVVSPEYEPPFGHAEELSLAAFGRRMNIDADEAMKVLNEAGLTVNNQKQSLAEIAIQNNARPMDVYMHIKHLEQAPKIEQEQQLSVVDIETMFGAGSGTGRKTVAEIAESINVSVELALERLTAAGIDTTADAMLRDIKEDNELSSASDIVLIMLDMEKE